MLNHKKEMRSQEVAQLEGEVENLQSELRRGLTEIKEVQDQKVELSEFKSIRNQLNIGRIIAENQQLKAFKEKVLRFAGKLGLKQQFDRFMKGNVEKER